MARVMIVQASGRRKGFTATLMREVVDEFGGMDGIEPDVHHLHDYRFGPCNSCFYCIRNVGAGCILDDDWGRKGEGPLYTAFMAANALLIVDPVHTWGVSAASRVFVERIYPTFWVGRPHGMPFASISCASNQGFQYRAMVDFCKISAAKSFRYVGGLPVHVAYFDEAKRAARSLGRKLAEAALVDERSGRKKPTDEEIFQMYRDTPWSLLDGYLQNLTNNTFDYDTAVPVVAREQGRFTKPGATGLLDSTCDELKIALDAYHAGDRETAASACARAAKFWTNATFKEICEEEVVGAKIPAAYRPLDELDGEGD